MSIDELIQAFEDAKDRLIYSSINSDRMYKNSKSALSTAYTILQHDNSRLKSELEIIKAEITDKTGITRDEIDKFIEGQVKRHAKTN
jgi:hypothetical protein